MFLNSHWTCQYGELDLIFKKKGLLVFVEVRAKNSIFIEDSQSFFSFKKRQTLLRTIDMFFEHGSVSWRLDLILIKRSNLQLLWIQNALTSLTS